MKRTTLGILILATVLCAPWPARAQSAATGAIAGIARDTTGAVLPGVTVEAASPALIEKVRTAVTDDQGNYKIIDLRPGAYSVTFTLPGFSTFKREGIELSAGFTATVNGEMRVGALEETVTVTGASPVVDIQNVRSQNVLSNELLTSIPVAKTILGLVNITLGATNIGNAGPIVDVGGSKGDGSTFFAIHGVRSNDQRMLYDGLSENIVSGGGGGRRLIWTNQVAVQETVVVTGAASPEMETGGMTLNTVPREGGNSFSVNISGAFTNGDLQNDNLTDTIRRQGVTALPGVKRIYDWGVGIGGRIIKDRLWFYSSNRKWGSEEYQPGAYYNGSSNAFVFTPDLSKPAHTDLFAWDMGGRLTWQAAQKHKVTFSYNYQKNCQCHIFVNVTRTPEGAPRIYQSPLKRPAGTWSYTASNRLLIEGGATYNDIAWTPTSGAETPALPRIQDLTTGFIWGNNWFGVGAGGNGQHEDQTLNQRLSATYVMGSHAFKVGQVLQAGKYGVFQDFNPQQLWYTFAAGRPTAVIQFALPFEAESHVRALGLYAQDQWTLRRLTLNLGLRYDQFTGWVPAGTRTEGPYLAAFAFDRVENVPNFKDVSPRVGAAYDVFGNGKTAIKGFFGRYVGGVGSEFADANNPSRNVVVSASRTWNDANANFTPDCTLTNFATNGECGPLSNSAFGRPSQNTFYGPSAVEGWGNRPYSYQGTLALQHELRPGVALNVSYFHTRYSAFTVSSNTLVTAASFTPYCVTAPVDARLPGGGGNRICGLYDVNPASFGRANNVITAGSEFGKQVEKYNGVDAAVNVRFGRGLLNGGVSFGQQVTDNCYVNSRPDLTPFGYLAGTPRSDAYCHVTPPWSAGTQLKAHGVYPLPWWGIEPSFTLQNLPGTPLLATWNASNAVVAPALGRNLAACPAAGACTATAAVALIPGGTEYLDRVTQLDLRVTKVVTIGRTGRVRGMFDIYNMFNTAAIVNVVTTFGPAWQRPAVVQGGRLFKFSAQVDF